MKSTALIIVFSLLLVGCSGTQYRDLKSDWSQPALIKIQRIKNDTAEHIDTKMLADEIATSLIQMRIQFVDDAYSKEAIQEMERGMTGLVDPDSAIPAGNLKSPNFFLFGSINENVRYTGGKKLQYLVVTIAK